MPWGELLRKQADINNFNCIWLQNKQLPWQIYCFGQDGNKRKGGSDIVMSWWWGWEVATHAPISAGEGDYPAAFGWWLIKTVLVLILAVCASGCVEGAYHSRGGYKRFFRLCSEVMVFIFIVTKKLSAAAAAKEEEAFSKCFTFCSWLISSSQNYDTSASAEW